MARFVLILTSTWAIAEGRPEIITPEVVAGAERVTRFFCNQALLVHGGGHRHLTTVVRPTRSPTPSKSWPVRSPSASRRRMHRDPASA